MKTVALFGEAEKGDFETLHVCDSLPQLVNCLGNPPTESQGLFYAVQALLFHRNLIFIRVKEEGFSYHDYINGLHLLENHHLISQTVAIGLPGVGNAEILHAAIPICLLHHSILLTTESDFYDYATSLPI